MDVFYSLSVDEDACMHNELVAAVLCVIVEASTALDAQSLCSLLQLNTRCRKAVLGSRGHHSISIKASGHTVAGFLAWLPRHAGLVAGLQLVALRNGTVTNWSYQQKARPPLDTAFASALQQCSAAAHAVGPFSTSAAHPAGTAEGSSTMPLLLTSFSSKVYVTTAILQGLPCATLTRLELCKHRHHDPGTLPGDVAAVLGQLTNPNTLKLRTNHCLFDSIFGPCPSGSECIRRLPYLPTSLTCLDIGRLESLNTAILPTSLVQLMLIVEFKDPCEPPSDDQESDESASDGEDEWEEMADEDWVEQEVHHQQVIQEVDQEAAQRLLQAAWRLDLTHLPLLQRCKVRRMLSYSEEEAEERYDYTKTMTIALAAPHLTRLELCNFSDVYGLPVPCEVQELWLIGCSMRASRIAQLVSHMPDLVDFRYNGYDVTRDELCCNLQCQLVQDPVEEERMVAAALSGATKLTSLIVDGFGMHESPEGCMVWGDNGLVVAPARACGATQEPPPSTAHQPDQDPSRVHWGYHVSGLVNLRCLVLCALVQASDVLQLTALTALTQLIWDDSGHEAEIEDAYEALVPHLPALEVLNPWMVDMGMLFNSIW